jgi:hypothetical protein
MENITQNSIEMSIKPLNYTFETTVLLVAFLILCVIILILVLSKGYEMKLTIFIVL